MTEQECIPIFNQLFNGAKYLQLNGIIHRDIKQGNILVVDKTPLRVKIGDFGLATIVGNTNLTPRIYGMFSVVCSD